MILGLVFVLILLLSAASPLATEPQAVLTTEHHSAKDLVLAVGNSPHDTHYIPVLAVNGAIGPAVSDFITRKILAINSRAIAPAIFITVDTPGGLSSSLRVINQHILNSVIPIVCLVHPSGARAASAGTYMLYACHVAAMATATTIGAATPVMLPSPLPSPAGADRDNSQPSAMQSKVINDSVAYIRSLAQLRKRNQAWAELAVSEAATLTASEALDKQVIDIIAESPEQLLIKLSDPQLSLAAFNQPLDSTNTQLTYRHPDWRSQFIATITNPNISYILLMIGIYGLILEFFSPGIGISGVTGAIALFLGLYALQMLPLNFTGLSLVILGILLFSIETLRPSFGVFGLGGIIAFSVGSIFLIDTQQQAFKISALTISFTALLSIFFSLFVLGYLWRNRTTKVVSGQSLILASKASVSDNFQGSGHVSLAGESWAAYSAQPLKKGQIVSIEEVRGLILVVKLHPEGEQK